MGRVEGKVALITGVARGQGRSHALRLAEEGADIVGIDLCEDLPNVPFPLGSEEDLEKTRSLIEGTGRRAVLHKGDVRRTVDIESVVQDGLSAFGYIDVVVANAGIGIFAPTWEMAEHDWIAILDTNLTGAWRTAKSAIPQMIEAGRGGSIMFTASGAALRANGNLAAYAASKTGLMGLARELALELGPHRIRVNTVHPTAVKTPMLDNDYIGRLFKPDLPPDASADERREATADVLRGQDLLGVGWIDAADVSNAVLFLASDESRMITGTPFRVDAGYGWR